MREVIIPATKHWPIKDSLVTEGVLIEKDRRCVMSNLACLVFGVSFLGIAFWLGVNPESVPLFWGISIITLLIDLATKKQYCFPWSWIILAGTVFGSLMALISCSSGWC
jgi:hypothetical protein